jgi:hypothetical protein
MSTCAHCGIVRVHIALFFQCNVQILLRMSGIQGIPILLNSKIGENFVVSVP